MILFVVIGCGGSLTAQTAVDYAPLADRLAEYGKLTMNWDIDGLLDLTAPELFEVVPRATLRQQMSGLLSDEDMRVTFHDFAADRIGEAVAYRGTTYAPVSCHFGLTFELLSERYRDPKFSGRMVRMLEKTYGRVAFDAARHRIEVYVPKELFAIQPAADAPWYFVEYRSDNAALMDLIIPAAVREQFR